MKKLFTLALSLVIFSASASKGSSELTLKLFNNSAFSVVLDNAVYDYQTTSYNFTDLHAGNHYIKVTTIQSYNCWGIPIPKTTVIVLKEETGLPQPELTV